MASDDEIARALRLLQEHVAGKRGAECALTVAELFATYDRLHGPTLVDRASYRSRAKGVCRVFGDRRVMDLRAALLLEEYRAARPELAHWTVVQHMYLLKSASAWAFARELLPSNPLAGMKLPVRKHGLRSHVRTPQEAQRILAHADDLIRAVFLLGYDCFMRPGEARRLRWDQLMSHVEDGRTTWEAELTKTKTKRVRLVPLTSRTMEAIRKWPMLPDCPWIFANPHTRKPFGPHAVRDHWVKVRDAAGVMGDVDDPRPMGLHSAGRRSAINRARRAGIPDNDAMAISGHATPSTYTYYQVPDARDARRVRDVLEREYDRRPPKRAPDMSAEEPPSAIQELLYSQVKKH